MIRKGIYFFVFITISASAQDIHFSQFSITRSVLNPGLISYQDLDFQLEIQRRSQWKSVATPFTTFSISLNRRSLLPKTSVGINFIRDLAGDSQLSTRGFSLTVSHKLNASLKHNISIGASVGSYKRSVDYNTIIFIDNENIPNTNIQFIDLSIGLMHEVEINPSLIILSGFSLLHINQPEQSLTGNNKIRLPINNKLHTSIIYYFNDRVQFKPSILYSKQGTSNEFIFGAGINYLLSNYGTERIVIRTAFFNRHNDALIPKIGVKIDKFEAMMSYDINTSSLVSASDYKGGFEFSIVYQWGLNKSEKSIEQGICPKYL